MTSCPAGWTTPSEWIDLICLPGASVSVRRSGIPTLVFVQSPASTLPQTVISDTCHIFISYASEDRAFAEWLARKLAAAGYAVWLDTLKMLGGESWPRTIEDALRRSGRFLAVMSVHSLEKDLPLKERTAALGIGLQREVSDFVIPLRLDDAEWDWTMRDLSSVPFLWGWATGWRQLLKKLDQIAFPRALTAGALLAEQSMGAENFVIPEPESLRLNAIGVEIAEKIVRVFSLPPMTDAARSDLKQKWACYFAGDKAIALADPPREMAKGIVATKARHLWSDSGAILGIPVSTIMPALVRSSMWARLQHLGCHVHPKKPVVFYLPESFNDNGKLAFTDPDGKRRTHKIRRYNTVRRGMEKEKVYFHFAFRCDLAKGLDAGFYIQLVPTLMLFDASGGPIVDDRVNRLRRKITRGYYNAEWRDRFLAAEQLLLGTQTSAKDGITLASAGITLTAPCRLNETLFQKDPTPEPNADESEDAGELVEDEPFTVADLDEE